MRHPRDPSKSIILLLTSYYGARALYGVVLELPGDVPLDYLTKARPCTSPMIRNKQMQCKCNPLCTAELGSSVNDDQGEDAAKERLTGAMTISVVVPRLTTPQMHVERHLPIGEPSKRVIDKKSSTSSSVPGRRPCSRRVAHGLVQPPCLPGQLLSSSSESLIMRSDLSFPSCR